MTKERIGIKAGTITPATPLTNQDILEMTEGIRTEIEELGSPNEIGVILTAKDIPDNSNTTKRTGTTIYILRKEIKIYGEMYDETYSESNPERHKKISQEGIVFLIKHDDPHNITAIPRDTILIWITNEDEYYNYLYKKRTREE